jgi:hypothetical protein
MNKCKSVTITGADDEVDPKELQALSKEFPYVVEWAILFSHSKEGVARYPSAKWRKELEILAIESDDMWLAAHFCGGYTRNIMAGSAVDYASLSRAYYRVQLNGFAPSPTMKFYNGVEWIIQATNKELLNESVKIAHAENDVVSALWDCSGGQGIKSTEWPLQPLGLSLGYAGGINAENVVESIKQIEKVTRHTFWIDMESGVRTNNKFDLVKVRQVLEAAKPYLI